MTPLASPEVDVREETITVIETVSENDVPTHRHFFKKDDLAENSLSGFPIRALCGYTKFGTAKHDTKLPICQDCEDIFDGLIDFLPGQEPKK